MSTTEIGWATHVWNPMTGCDVESPGCSRCYAREYAARLKEMELARTAKAIAEGKEPPPMRYQNDGDPKTSGPGFAFTVHWDRLENPPKWPAGARVFVNSMSDVFHEEAPIEAIYRLLDTCKEQPDVNFLILTKQAERMSEVLVRFVAAYGHILPNVWLGVSIENRRFVHRADLLRQTPAAVRFISAEPLLGPLLPDADHLVDAEHLGYPIGDAPVHAWREWADGYKGAALNLERIDWLIAGAESGPARRRFDVDWVRELRDDTQEWPWQDADGYTRFFFKQGSAHRPGQHRKLDGRTWDELPKRPDGLPVRTTNEVAA